MAAVNYTRRKPPARPSRNRETGSRYLLKSFLYGVLAVLGAVAYYIASRQLGADTAQWLAHQASIIAATGNLDRLLASPAQQAAIPIQEAAGSIQHIDTPTPRHVIVSYHPLVIIVEDFLSQGEAAYIENLAQGGGRNVSHRGESTAPSSPRSLRFSVSTTDPIVQRVITRASSFQGFLPKQRVHAKVIRYATGQREKPHYVQSHREMPRKAARRHEATNACMVAGAGPRHGDVNNARAPERRRDHHKQTHHHHNSRHKKGLNPGFGCHSNGISVEERPEWETTISVVLKETCGGGCGTQFPKIHIDWSTEDRRWCDLVDCDEKVLTIRAKPGNAIFWKNTNAVGGRDDATLHTSLSGPNGNKVELNIWALNGMPAV
ncbi:hypothetical protein MCOR02_003166 [Pyricularia oryzae]|uniref:Uncharacterized protein n=1 Tax=Pyricularia grisea TaxID=148305 RepID=A0ABQ8N9S0_PYRGI|nr:hypothetical protein MCOR02_003166 [Pyricularia oryzae]KAI6293501.1 hypothetical protein MCOR33_009113 [Pyricularia grisea]KAI6266701.1 hypothetical protein MCOR26_010064 [Pyricularia oryzae]KAI6312463.1 hypothetical protein MCOR34_005580 [Pyricularia oryzae]KAI6339321.1 hypothetical protein MCOR28_007362 [Pyricularia oryzae]